MNDTVLTMEQKQAQVGCTVDGVQIVDGLHVFTNEMRAGRVSLDDVRPWSDGWFEVVYVSGGRVMQNADRVATHFGGRSAAMAYSLDVELAQSAAGDVADLGSFAEFVDDQDDRLVDRTGPHPIYQLVGTPEGHSR